MSRIIFVTVDSPDQRFAGSPSLWQAIKRVNFIPIFSPSFRNAERGMTSVAMSG